MNNQMNDLMTLIQNRRSIRQYKDQPVPAEALEQILEAVRWSPSWANCQCWEVVAVRDQEIKTRIQATVSPTNPAYKAVAQAPVLLALCAKMQSSGYYKGLATTQFGDWFMYDLGLATQNLCLMAHRLGLGTVIVGMFDHAKAGEILQIPEYYQLISLIPLGFPAKISAAPKRRTVETFTHFERW